MSILIWIRGGGDLASGAALRLRRAGLRLAMTELPQPLVVRRSVSFAEAIYSGEITVEGVTARRVDSPEAFGRVLQAGEIPILADPDGCLVQDLRPEVLVDARMTKQPPESGLETAELVIGLGPGFVAGLNCHAVIETNRGHRLGSVIWHGPPEMDTGVPEQVAAQGVSRVLRAPADGVILAHAEICDHLEPGQLIAEIGGLQVLAPFTGVLRGLIHPGLNVSCGMKIGDVDPRDNPRLCRQVSDKSLAVGGGVLEAILSRPALRKRLWD